MHPVGEEADQTGAPGLWTKEAHWRLRHLTPALSPFEAERAEERIAALSFAQWLRKTSYWNSVAMDARLTGRAAIGKAGVASGEMPALPFAEQRTPNSLPLTHGVRTLKNRDRVRSS